MTKVQLKFGDWVLGWRDGCCREPKEEEENDLGMKSVNVVDDEKQQRIRNDEAEFWMTKK